MEGKQEKWDISVRQLGETKYKWMSGRRDGMKVHGRVEVWEVIGQRWDVSGRHAGRIGLKNMAGKKAIDLVI